MSEKKQPENPLEKKPLEKNELRIAGLFFDLEKTEKTLDEIIRRLAPEGELIPGTPLHLDLSMKISPEGEIILEDNSQKMRGFPASEPLVEILEQKETITITAELPGIKENSIKINLLENKAIEIIAFGEKNFYKKIGLSAPVESNFQNKLKNGILELRLEKKPQ